MLHNGGGKRPARTWLVIGLSVCCIDIAKVSARSEEEHGSQCNPQPHHSPSESLLQVAAQRVAGILFSKPRKQATKLLEKAKPVSPLSKEGPAEKTDTKSDNAGVNEEDIQAFLDSYGMEKHLASEQALKKAEKAEKQRKARRMKARLRTKTTKTKTTTKPKKKNIKKGTAKTKQKQSKATKRKQMTSRQKTKHSKR